MKKLLAVLSVAALASPGLAFAAYDDVQLAQTSTVLNIGSIEVDVTSATANLETLVVTDTDFTVTMQSGSSITVSAPSLNRLYTSTGTGRTATQCDGSASNLSYTASAALTLTVTPSSSLCSSSSGGSGGASTATTPNTTTSSGGGGSIAPAAPAVVAPASQGPTTPTTPTTLILGNQLTSNASGLSDAQVQSILDVLASFNADAATIANVRASLGSASPGNSAGAPSVPGAVISVFARTLTTGSVGADVKALQQYLNTHGASVSATGVGSAGKETTRFGAATKAALVKFQKAHGITPASGYFGEKTRAYIQANP